MKPPKEIFPARKGTPYELSNNTLPKSLFRIVLSCYSIFGDIQLYVLQTSPNVKDLKIAMTNTCD